MSTTSADVIDTNNVQQGAMNVAITFDGEGPLRVQHKGKDYIFTGKSGTNHATGIEVRELATVQDARIWISLDGKAIWED